VSYTSREKRLGGATVLVLGCALIYITGIKPTWTRYQELTEQRKTVQSDVTLLEEKNRVNRQYRQRWKGLKTQLATADADQFWKNLERELRKQDVSLKSHSKGHGEKLKKVSARRVPYQCNLTCDYEGLANLLASIRRMDDFMRAENITIIPQKKGRFQVNVSFSTLVAETGEEG